MPNPDFSSASDLPEVYFTMESLKLKINGKNHEVKVAPTGLGEPPFPPVFAALANALYRAKGKRFYNQPFNVI